MLVYLLAPRIHDFYVLTLDESDHFKKFYFSHTKVDQNHMASLQKGYVCFCFFFEFVCLLSYEGKRKEKHLGDDLISSEMSLEMFRLIKKQI